MPANLALDSKGDLYVLDGGNERVQVYDPSGKFISMWGSQGSGDGQFNLLVHEDFTYTVGGILLDKTDHVYVGDGLNARIQVFDSRGNFLMKWGSYGLKDGQFLRVLDLAMDAQGYIYVVDDHRNDIQKFDPQGKFIMKFAEPGTGDGQLSNTGGITVGADGNLYIADYGNNRVEVFSTAGKYLRQWPTPVPKVADIAIDANGNIFTTHEFGQIVEYDSTGKPISVMNNLGLDSPGGIVINSNGLIYVADNKGIEVLREK
jgi:tripartite motif-containing protein 71